MGADWEIIKRGDVRPQFAGIYVTMNRAGDIVMSRVTWERMGSPDASNILYDRTNNRIGLKPTRAVLSDAYPVRVANRSGAKLIRGHRLTKDHNIDLPFTIHFKDARIDDDGILILDIRTATQSNRAKNHRANRAEV